MSRGDFGGDLSTANLVLAGADAVLARTDGEVVDLFRGGQGVLNIVPLAGVFEELEAAILTFERAAPAAGSAGRRRPRRVRARGAGASGARRALRTSPSDGWRSCSLLRRALRVRAGRVRVGVAEDGSPRQAFRPDFYLPEWDAFVELTTLNQRLVTRKNAKVRRLKELHPGIEVKLLYQRDYLALLDKYGLARESSPAA